MELNKIVRLLGGTGFLKVVFAMAATRGLSVFTGIAIAVLLARALGTDQYGKYLFAITVAQLLALPVLMGTPTLLTREVASYFAQDKKEAFVRGIARWSALLVLFFFTVIAFFYVLYFLLSLAFVQIPSIDNLIWLALPFVFTLALVRIFSAFLQGMGRPFLSSLADGTLRPLFLLGLCSVWLIQYEISAPIAMTLHIVASGLALSWVVLATKRVLRSERLTLGGARSSEEKKWFKSLLPLAVIAAAGILNSRVDLFMLGVLVEPREVAMYGVAAQISGLALVGQTILNTIAAPKFSAFYANQKIEEMDVLNKECARTAVLFSLGFSAFLFFVGHDLILLALGDDFLPSVQLALIMVVGYTVTAALGPVALTLNMAGFEDITARVTWATMGLNVAINIALIPIFGAMGAVVTTVLALVVRQLILWRAQRRLIFTEISRT